MIAESKKRMYCTEPSKTEAIVWHHCDQRMTGYEGRVPTDRRTSLRFYGPTSHFLTLLISLTLLLALALTSCVREPLQKEVVKETVLVEKPVTRIVKETVIVETEVTRVVKHTVLVPKDVTVTPSPLPRVTSVGVIDTGGWLIEIVEVRSELGKDPSRQNVIILANVTNQGMKTDTFSSFSVMLKDSKGRKYEADFGLSIGAPNRYGTEIAASVSPEATVYTAIVFDVPASEDSFTVIPGFASTSWSGDVSFTLE